MGLDWLALILMSHPVDPDLVNFQKCRRLEAKPVRNDGKLSQFWIWAIQWVTQPVRSQFQREVCRSSWICSLRQLTQLDMFLFTSIYVIRKLLYVIWRHWITDLRHSTLLDIVPSITLAPKGSPPMGSLGLPRVPSHGTPLLKTLIKGSGISHL